MIGSYVRTSQAMVTMGYFGLMHVGELAKSACGHAVIFGDVNYGCNKKKIVIIVRSSDTQPFTKTSNYHQRL